MTATRPSIPSRQSQCLRLPLDPLDREKLGAWSVAGAGDVRAREPPVRDRSCLHAEPAAARRQPVDAHTSGRLRRACPSRASCRRTTSAPCSTALASARPSVAGISASAITTASTPRPFICQGTVDIGGAQRVEYHSRASRASTSPAFDFSTTFKKLEIHGESVFRLASSNGRDSRFQWIGGAAYTRDVGHRWLDQVMLLSNIPRRPPPVGWTARSFPSERRVQVGDLLAPNARIATHRSGRVLPRSMKTWQVRAARAGRSGEQGQRLRADHSDHAPPSLTAPRSRRAARHPLGRS